MRITSCDKGNAEFYIEAGTTLEDALSLYEQNK